MKITLPTERVCAMFSEISGEQGEKYYDMCAVAARSLLGRIKGNIDLSPRESELIYAAACLAHYRLVLAKCSDGVSVYKAGDMNIGSDLSCALSAAKTLLRDALAAISDCLVANDFCFKTV